MYACVYVFVRTCVFVCACACICVYVYISVSMYLCGAILLDPGRGLIQKNLLPDQVLFFAQLEIVSVFNRLLEMFTVGLLCFKFYITALTVGGLVFIPIAILFKFNKKNII